MEYIYSRVSTDKQATENQLFNLTRLYPNAEVIEETISGTKVYKPVLNALLDRLLNGDTLIVAALDRLGRSSGEAILLMNSLYKRDIKVVSIREGLDYSTSSGKLIGQITLAVSENERNLISERTKNALAVKKSQGIILGRPRLDLSDTIKLLKQYRSQGLTYREIRDKTNMSIGRIYQLLKAS